MPLTLILQRCKVLLSGINNSLKICWGNSNISGSNSNLQINLPISYGYKYMVTNMIRCGTSKHSGYVNGIISKSLSSFSVYQRDSGTIGFDWISIGY